MKQRRQNTRLPHPQLQIEFAACLAAARRAFLIDALREAVGVSDLALVDKELRSVAPREALSGLAAGGLRGELVFPVPCLLRANPKLLSYYRLLLGVSQKSFYARGCGMGAFKSMEDAGSIGADADLRSLCRQMAIRMRELVEGIGIARITHDLLDDLTLLTLGPQLRGGANVRKGTASIQAVFEIIHTLVKGSRIRGTARSMELKNAAGRRVTIAFSSDPDIVIRERIGKDDFRNIIAIEVKGGTDYSNIHNRLGEAEKSHQKARKMGYVECWTVVNVAGLNANRARQESPSTNRFYVLSDILDARKEGFVDFRTRLRALTGIA